MIDCVLTDAETRRFVASLRKYVGAYEFTLQSLGRTTQLKDSIDTGDAEPLHSRSCRISSPERPTNGKDVAVLNKDVSQPFSSPWDSTVVLVRKHGRSWRVSGDYRRLNKITKNDACPLTSINDTLNSALCNILLVHLPVL